MIVFRIILALFGLLMLGGCIVLTCERAKTWKDNTIFYNIVHVLLTAAIFIIAVVCFDSAFI